MRCLRPLPVSICASLFLTVTACPEPDPEGSDGGPSRDARVSDASSDAAVIDTGTRDTSMPDATAPDQVAPDSSDGDAATTDAITPDTALADVTSADAEAPDLATEDAPPADSAVDDAGAQDGSRADATAPDTARPDTALPDVGTDPYIQIFAPNGGEVWPVGFEKEISWNTANLDDTVFVYYSKDYFTSDVNVIAADQIDDGTHTWTVPDDVSESVRVKVAATTAMDMVYDLSDMPFSIVVPTIEVTSPSSRDELEPGGSFEIRWTTSADLDAVRIEYSTDGFADEAIEIVDATPDNGSYTWRPVPFATTDSLTIRISAVGHPEIFDVSDAPCAILPWIQLTSPIGGEEWNAGQSRLITWDSSQSGASLTITYSTDGFERDINAIARGVEDSGSFPWLVLPDLESRRVRVRVHFSDNPEIAATSGELTVERGGWAQTWPQPNTKTKVATGPRGALYAVSQQYEGGEQAGCVLRRYDDQGQIIFERSFPTAAPKCFLAVDSAGSVYVFGEFAGTLDLDPGAGEQLVEELTPSIFMVKLDARGDYAWGAALGNGDTAFYLQGIATHGTASMVLYGQFFTNPPGGQVDLDPGPGEALRPYAASQDCYLISLAGTDGALQWAETWGGTQSESADDVTIAATGTVYASGTFQGEDVDFDPGAGTDARTAGATRDAFIVRYSPAGVYEGAHTWGGSGTVTPRSLATDRDDHLYVVGELQNLLDDTIDFQTGGGDPWLVDAGDWPSAFVAKYDRHFDFAWAYGFGGSNSDNAKHATVRAAGDLIVVGQYDNGEQDVDFDPGDETRAPPSGAPDAAWYLSQFDLDGELIETQVLTQTVYSLAADGDNVIYVGGSAFLGSELAPTLAPCRAASCPAVASGGSILRLNPDFCW